MATKVQGPSGHQLLHMALRTQPMELMLSHPTRNGPHQSPRVLCARESPQQPSWPLFTPDQSPVPEQGVPPSLCHRGAPAPPARALCVAVAVLQIHAVLSDKRALLSPPKRPCSCSPGAWGWGEKQELLLSCPEGSCPGAPPGHCPVPPEHAGLGTCRLQCQGSGPGLGKANRPQKQR